MQAPTHKYNIQLPLISKESVSPKIIAFAMAEIRKKKEKNTSISPEM